MPARTSELQPGWNIFVDLSAKKRSPARAEAMDWLLRLEAAPSDSALKRQFELWLEQSDSNRAAFRSVHYTWKQLGRLATPQRGIEALPDNVVPLPAPSALVFPRIRPLSRGHPLRGPPLLA